MLVLTRKNQEHVRLTVGDVVIWLTICDIDRGKVRIGITAPRGVEILRSELIEPEHEHGGEA